MLSNLRSIYPFIFTLVSDQCTSVQVNVAQEEEQIRQAAKLREAREKREMARKQAKTLE